MKRFILSLIISLTGFVTAFGMGFNEAQQHAYYLTDKMAYELDLTPDQYDQVYQVNLEYLLNVRSSNPYDYYWDYRNTDLSYILYDWQYSIFRATDYFFRPLVWRASAWFFPVWNHYQRSYYFFGRPSVWHSYRGGLWRSRTHHTPSPFVGRRPSVHHGGMRNDRYPGAHHGGQPGGKPALGGNHGGGNRPGFGGNHGGNNRPGFGGNHGGNNRPSGGFGGNHGGNNRPSGGYDGNHGGNNRPSGGYDGNRGGNNRPSGGYEGNRGGNNRPSGGYDGNRGGSSRPSVGFNGGSRGSSTSSFGGSSRPSSGFSGASRSAGSFSGSHGSSHAAGGRSFGGRH